MLSKVLPIVILIFMSGKSFAQESEVVVIEWQDPVTLYDGEDEVMVPSIKGQTQKI